VGLDTPLRGYSTSIEALAIPWRVASLLIE
jgi:hypothetical protein